MKIRSILPLIMIILISTEMLAQEEFSSLSPKQKIRLAKKEQKAAKKDSEYLQMMDQALDAFQKKDYKIAMELYEKAHQRRPDNVYPVVMMDDIKLAQEAEENEVEVLEVVVEDESILEPEPEIIADEIKPETKAEERPEAAEEIIVPEDPEKKIVRESKENESAPVVTASSVSISGDKKGNGVMRKTYKEGSASVEEVTITRDGVSTVYKKVSHQWGAIYYFKDKDDISKDEWNKMLEGLEE